MFDKVTDITFGIRYVRSFRVPEISGQMIDEILRESASPFDAVSFPKIGENSEGAKILYKNENENRIVISRDDVILSQSILNFEEEYEQFCDSNVPYLIGLMKKYDIERILRFGFITRHKLPKKDRIIKNLGIQPKELREPVDFLFRTSKKIPTLRGLAISGDEGYSNVICTFESEGEDMYAAIDYQRYFDPVLEDVEEGKPEEFMMEARKYVASQHEWLQKLTE